MSHFSKTLIKFGVLILIINMIGIWTILLLDHRQLAKLQQFEHGSASTNSRVETSSETGTFSEIDTRLDAVEEAQDGFNTRIDQLESSFSAIEATDSRIVNTVSTVSKSSKESTIYLGEGSTTSREWTTIPATTITVDTAKYPGLSAVYFEAALSTNGGEAYAQLIDSQTGAIFSNPALMHNTADPTWKASKINLSSGSHTYVVQIRSSSGEMIRLSGARLRFVTN